MATKIILACDESGAKGYSSQKEKYPGECGVFAGILIAQEIEEMAYPSFLEIYQRYKLMSSKKLHITDLTPNQQDKLRKEIYGVIRELKLPCFWNAIHVEGFSAYWKKTNEIINPVGQNLRSQQRIKTGSPRNKKHSMYEELFLGLFGRVMAFLEERNRKKVSIEVRIDRVDELFVKNFAKDAKKLLDLDFETIKITGWDTETEKIVSATIKFKVDIPPNMDIEIEVESLEFNSNCHNDCYVLAADVLANSLFHLFRSRSKSDLYKPLNNFSAIRCHPIFDSFLISENSFDSLEDRLYKHPQFTGCVSDL